MNTVHRFLTSDFYRVDTNLFTLILVLLPLHVFGIFALLNLSLLTLVTFIFGYVLISGLGVAVGYHRYYAHRTFETSKFWQCVMTYLGVLSCQGSPVFWTIVHRTVHHAYADTEKDLHSPVNGKFNAYLGWIIFLVPKNVRLRGVSDLLRDKICMWFHKRFYKLVWATWAISIFVSTDLFLGLALAQIYAFHQENLIDLICHLRGWWGYRNNDTKDDSVNILPLGWLTWGQAFHNNHHAQPGSYDFGQRWFEVDPSKFLVRMVKSK